MNTLELQTEYRGLVDIIANKDADTIRRAIQDSITIKTLANHKKRFGDRPSCVFNVC